MQVHVLAGLATCLVLVSSWPVDHGLSSENLGASAGAGLQLDGENGHVADLLGRQRRLRAALFDQLDILSKLCLPSCLRHKARWASTRNGTQAKWEEWAFSRTCFRLSVKKAGRARALSPTSFDSCVQLSSDQLDSLPTRSSQVVIEIRTW